MKQYIITIQELNASKIRKALRDFKKRLDKTMGCKPKGKKK